MVNRSVEAPVHHDTDWGTISRRGFLALSGIAIAGGGTKVLFGRNAKRPTTTMPAQKNEESGSETSSENAVNIAPVIGPDERIRTLQLRDFYADDPEISPENLFGKLPAELEKSGAMPVTDETRDSKDGFAVGLARHMRRMGAAGRTTRDLAKARQEGYIVGEVEASSGTTKLGNYDEYTKEEYLKYLVPGFLSDENSTDAINDMIDYFASWSTDYERTLTDPRWYDYAGFMVEARYFGVDGTYGGDIYRLTVGRSTPEGSDWREEKTVHTGEIVINASENADETYDIILRRFHMDPKQQ